MLKKMIFFLSACNEQESLAFLRQYGYKQKEKKAFSTSFFNQLKHQFKKTNQTSDNQKDIKQDLFFYWRVYCRKNPMEEAIILVLCSILKIPDSKVAWVLKISPRLINFRLQQGLQSLGEELKEYSETPSAKKQDYKRNALNYCQKLNEENLPEKLEIFQTNIPIRFDFLNIWNLLTKSAEARSSENAKGRTLKSPQETFQFIKEPIRFKKIILSIKLLLLLLSILLIGFIVFSLYKKNRTVILYQSLFTQEFKVLV